MPLQYYVVVRVGQHEFLKEFESDVEALECFDSMSEDDGKGIDGNWATRPATVPVDTVTVIRRPTATKIGDPSRQSL